MRKLAAIIMIFVLAFNWYGYRLLLAAMDNENSINLQAKLDRGQYNRDDLFELHVPLNLPYIADSKDFENYSGEAIINGGHYRFIKRKLVNNELILLCIRDTQKDGLQKASTEFFKQVNDTPGAEKKSKTLPLKMVKAITTEFTPTQIESLNRFDVAGRDQYPIFQQLYTSVKLSTPAQPPNS